MRKALVFAVFLAVAAPLRAVEVVRVGDVAAVSFRLPVSGLLAAQDGLRERVIAQIQALKVPETGAALALPQSAGAQAIVRGLLDRPALLQQHAAELTQVLGKDHFQALKAAAALQAPLGSGPSVDPADPAAISRFASAYDGARVQSVPKELLVADLRSEDKPIPDEWRLHPSQKIHHSGPGEEERAVSALANSLRTMELPPYKEKFIADKIDAPLVAWAGLPSIWKLSLFREGGRQDPGNVLYVLDPSWYIQVPDGKGKNRVYVTKGVYFERDGRTAVLATYKHPRLTRYFGNLLTMDAFETDSGLPLEKDLDTPMSSSSRLQRVTNDKLWTRLLLAAEGARVPATRAFLLPDHVFLKKNLAIPNTPRVKAGPLPADRAGVRKAVAEFLRVYRGAEVVVKPSGPQFHSGRGVAFFARSEVDKITDYVIAVSKHEHMESQGVVLLEQRLTPPPVYLRLSPYSGKGPFAYLTSRKVGVSVLAPSEIATAQPHEKKDYNERVYVVRGPGDKALTEPLTFFRAGTWGKPTSGLADDPRDRAALVSFETMREAWISQSGVLAAQAEVDELTRERDDIGRKALTAIMANEKSLSRRAGEPTQDQTDMIGLDLMYQLEDGRLAPYVIEVNDHDAAGQHALDLFYPERAGEHSRAWIETMRRRARLDAFRRP